MTYIAKVGSPVVKVEIAPTAGKLTAAPVWVDVTESVRMDVGVTCSRGRNDYRSQAQVGRASLTFKNPDGDFTPGNVNGQWHPLRLGVPIRIWFAPTSGGGGELYNDSDLYDDGDLYDSGGGYDAGLQMLWSGFIDSYKVDPANAASVQITANDRLSVMQQVKLRHWETHEHLATSPTALFPLTEAAGASSVGEVAAGASFTLTPTQIGSGGSVDTGVGALPVDDGTVVGFSPADINNGWCYTGTQPNYVPNPTTALGLTGGYAISCFMNTFEAPAGSTCLFRIGSVDGWSFELRLTATGVLRAEARTPSAAFLSADAVTPLTTGEWFQVGATLTRAPSGQWRILTYVNGTQSGTGAQSFLETPPRPFPALGVTFGIGGATAAMYSGQVSHCAAWETPSSFTARMSAAYAAMVGAANETSTDRFLRVCRYAGLEGVVSGTGLSTVGRQQLNGQTVLDALETVAKAELSAVDVDGSGIPHMAPRNVRYNAPVALTLTAKDVNLGTTFDLDDSTVLNDVSGSRPGGPTIRVVNDASVTQHGTRSDTMELIVADDVQLASFVNWSANSNADPKMPRIDQLEVDAWTKQATIDMDAIFACTLNSRIQVTGLPATAPMSTYDLFVEGVTDVIKRDGWKRTFNTTTVNGSNTVWRLGTDGYSVLGSTTKLGV